MDHKVSLNVMLELCPKFKEEVLEKWMYAMVKEINKDKFEVLFKLTRAEEAAETRDVNMAWINVRIMNDSIKGVILDGGSGLNVILKSLARKLGVKWKLICSMCTWLTIGLLSPKRL